MLFVIDRDDIRLLEEIKILTAYLNRPHTKSVYIDKTGIHYKDKYGNHPLEVKITHYYKERYVIEIFYDKLSFREIGSFTELEDITGFLIPEDHRTSYYQYLNNELKNVI